MKIEKMENTEENLMSFLAANTLMNGCSYSDWFINPIEKEEVIDIIAKNQQISYKIYYNYHNKINEYCKLTLLKSFLNNNEYLESILSVSSYCFKITYPEYSIIVTHLLNKDNYELLKIMFKAKKLTIKELKKIKLDKELKQKCESFLMMCELTN